MATLLASDDGAGITGQVISRRRRLPALTDGHFFFAVFFPDFFVFFFNIFSALRWMRSCSFLVRLPRSYSPPERPRSRSMRVPRSGIG